MPVLQPSPINIQTDEWKEARPHLMRALNYLIKDIYEWIANIQGLGSLPSTSFAVHTHQSAEQGGDMPGADLTAAQVVYLQTLSGLMLVTAIESITGSQAKVDTHAGAADPHAAYQKESEKDGANGYAGLNASSRTTKGTDTTDDLIIDLAAKGLVLKDTQGSPHYWRVTIDNAGNLVISDLGVTKP